MLPNNVPARDAIDRRGFLRSALGAGIGIGLGVVVTPRLSEAVNEKVADATGHPTGNASLEQRIENQCANEPNPSKCKSDYKFNPLERLQIEVVGPINEEIGFRGIPSFILDLSRKDTANDPTEVITGGTEPFSFDRKEALAGVVSSLLFGAMHNATEKGIDTKTIPASQTVLGYIFWCLTRRFGIASSMTAHVAHNHTVVKLLEKTH